MPRIYKLSRTGLKLIYKIRHHKGHGIHSPFVFNMINKVIEEKTPYYAYFDLEQFIVEHSTKRKNILSKFNKLSFRLVNYFNSKQLLELGSSDGINTLCLTAPSSQIECISVEPNLEFQNKANILYSKWNRCISLRTNWEKPQEGAKYDCIVIDLNHYNLDAQSIKDLESFVHHKSFILIKGIRTNKKHQALWRNVKDMESRTVVLDLFNVGILFFDPTLYRWEYQISF